MEQAISPFKIKIHNSISENEVDDMRISGARLLDKIYGYYKMFYLK